MRKAFNFYRSYYDVFNQIRRDDDKLKFITALLNKQFHNIDPDGLRDIPLFAYESQRQVIESQVQGYIDKTGEQLEAPQGGSIGGQQGGSNTPQQQEKEKEKEKDDVKIDGVINYLNKKANRTFSLKTKNTRSAVRARISDGYSSNDFKLVIDDRCSKWLNDQKMREFLRPSTLFNPTHFESYLNEAKASEKRKPKKNKKSHADIFGKKTS